MKKIVVAAGAAMLLAGCARAFSNRSYVMDTVATLPSGDQISEVAEVVVGLGAPNKNESYVVWKRAGKETRLTELRQMGYIFPDKYNAQTHVSGDGNRVWLTHEGVTFASFDYEKAVAIFGEKGQPEWTGGSTQ